MCSYGMVSVISIGYYFVLLARTFYTDSKSGIFLKKSLESETRHTVDTCCKIISAFPHDRVDSLMLLSYSNVMSLVDCNSCMHCCHFTKYRYNDQQIWWHVTVFCHLFLMRYLSCYRYKNDPEILAMTNLVAAYQRNEILEFEKILKVLPLQQVLGTDHNIDAKFLIIRDKILQSNLFCGEKHVLEIACVPQSTLILSLAYARFFI